MNLRDAPFRVGTWRVNPALDEICRDGTTVKLEPRTMRVLICLAEHQGDVVGVDQLLDEVWKGLVVTQFSVYRAVAILRRALEDDARHPTYIASVPRRGYRLVAPIEMEAKWQEPEPLPDEPQEEAERPEQAAAPTNELPQVVPDTASATQLGKRRTGLRYGSIAIALLVLGSSVWWFSLRHRREGPAAVPAASAPSTAGPNGATSVVFAPPIHSIAVLPFVNMSGDSKQEYFSDGLSEEILNTLAHIDELRVAARTSAFSFKGKDVDVGTIGRRLNVAAILEGSVRRSAHTVRVTTQLVDATTGYHLWSDTYDRDLGNVLKLESEIASAVASALKVTLLDNMTERLEAGGTRNPQALNAYLRARTAELTANDAPAALAAIDLYDEAIRLDPNYARAIAFRSGALVDYAVSFATGPALGKDFPARGESDARHAIALAPRLADGHVALAWYHRQALQLTLADQEYRDALALAPGNAEVLLGYGQYAIRMGRTEEGLAAIRRAVELDPVNERARLKLGSALWSVRRYREAATELDAVLSLNPHDNTALAHRGFTSYITGELEAARASCESGSRTATVILVCQAVTYGKLGRRADAAAALAAIKSAFGDAAAYQYMQIYAQWGDVPRALEWLERALQLKDSGLESLKIDPLLDPLRNEPRFQAVMRDLKFPD